jgi:ADP-ribosylglycohydrolase
LSLRERIAGGMWGLLTGDALGVPFEFHPPLLIPPVSEIELEPPSGFRRSHAAIPAGTWSDDGAHALCLLASLLECGRLDVEDLGRRLIAWYEGGYLAVDGKVFDLGVQTGKALQALRRGVPALEAGPADEHDNGNGSLMRVLPLALWHRGSDAELVADAHTQSRVTHGHQRAQACCALYCLWARGVLREQPAAWDVAVQTLEDLYDREYPRHLAQLEFHIRPRESAPGTGSGYVVDCLRSARQVMRAGTYEAVVRAAVALGRDTDTTACVAGGIAGVRDGVDAIPARWLSQLRGRTLAEPLIEALCQTV